MKDNITVNSDKGEIEYTEKGILEYNPNTGFEKGDKEQFWGVFKGIPAGTMIEQDGKIIFVEKISPTEPFQVSVFENENELKYYLKKMMLFKWFVVQPVIMVNDELI